MLQKEKSLSVATLMKEVKTRLLSRRGLTAVTRDLKQIEKRYTQTSWSASVPNTESTVLPVSGPASTAVLQP